MADIVVPGHHHSRSQTISSMIPTLASDTEASDFEMVPNPHFIFPRIPQPSEPALQPAPSPSPAARPSSMMLDAPRPRSNQHRHQRTASNLPAFNFNASDTSGLKPEEPRPSTPQQTSESSDASATTPSRHIRNNSELIGGDSRLGMNNAVRTSPTKPVSRSGHRRGHSVALSHHDLNGLITSSHTPRLSSSLPNTPLDHPMEFKSLNDTSCPDPLDESLTDVARVPSNDRPASRREVAFSPNVEIIPRPLSTISSETESSLSTVRGHSVNNSISSVLSMGMHSPASARVRSLSLETTPEHEPRPAPRSSLDLSSHVEKKGSWLKDDVFQDHPQAPTATPTVPSPKLAFADHGEVQPRPRPVHKRKQSLGQTFGFDRRKSEPLIGMHMNESSGLSALSLQESAPCRQSSGELGQFHKGPHRSSTRRIRDWALSKFSRKLKGHSRSQSDFPSMLSAQSKPAEAQQCPPPVEESPSPVAETDLDAVFSSQATYGEAYIDTARPHSMYELNTPLFAPNPTSSSTELEEQSSMLDLDAALGPFKTPPLGSQRHRRQMHSSRSTRDGNALGGLYSSTPSHRRAESAPMLTPFEFTRVSTPPQSAMADVFEEDEDDDTDTPDRPLSSDNAVSSREDEAGVGISVVDADMSAHGLNDELKFGSQTDLHDREWEMDRPSTSYGNPSSRLSTPITDRRPSSILDETIEEEPSQMESLEIVEAHEEPRAASFAKSSDSSETPTLLAPQPDSQFPEDQQHYMTHNALQVSNFSTEFPQRQSSFDTSRVGTSASSVTDNRTLNSCSVGEMSHDVRTSVDDVPSLTSSRSTMMTHGNASRRDVNGTRTPSMHSGTQRPSTADYRRKRSSIPSLSRLVTNSFGSDYEQPRPRTASDALAVPAPRKKEHRLKKLMFWKSKQRTSSTLES